MIGLIKKDLMMTRLYAFIFFLCSLLYMGTYLFIKKILFHSVITDTEFSRMALSIMPLLLVLELNCKHFQFDSTGRQSEKYFNSLPVSRSCMVLSKFTSAFISTVYGLIMSFICMTAFTWSDKMSLHLTPYKHIFTAFLGIIIVLAFQMPVLVYNGNELLSFVIPVICISLPVLCTAFIKKLSINETITTLSDFMKRNHITADNLVLFMLALAVLSLILSACISIYIYKRREF